MTDNSGNTAISTITVQIVNGGVFGPVINTPANPVNGVPVVPMNMVLLDNGKILFWDGGPNCLGAISPTVWDPVAGTFTGWLAPRTKSGSDTTTAVDEATVMGVGLT